MAYIKLLHKIVANIGGSGHYAEVRSFCMKIVKRVLSRLASFSKASQERSGVAGDDAAEQLVDRSNQEQVSTTSW